MSAKRALIVDDSKSARAFLARILERYELAVDTAESAEQAIEYLTRAQPDVIFMDHLMPGMDGFQAVQSIKNNPRTAMIPIMMYTSQEGELYLGQARALGAIGVMPKQIRPADVSKVLYQLKLLPDRRGGDQTSFTPANSTALVATSTAAPSDALGTVTGSGSASPLAVSAEIRQMVDSVVREQLADLRRAISHGLDKQSERLLGDVKAAVAELPPPPAPVWPEPLVTRPRRAGWIVAALASLVAAVLGYNWWLETAATQRLAMQLVTLEQRLLAAAPRRAPPDSRAAMTPSPAAMVDGTANGTVSSAVNGAAAPTSDLTLLVPYGDNPLVGDRLEALRAAVTEMSRRGLRGAAIVTSYAGRFCLVGNPGEGYALAPDDMPFAKCDVVGNPYDDGMGPAQREPVAMANLRASLRQQSAGRLAVVLGTGRKEIAAYPTVDDKLGAGEWNRAATANNRVELRFRAAP